MPSRSCQVNDHRQPSPANIQAQVEEVRRVLETETNYEQEADYLRRARRLFREEDEIVVPRVYDQYSSRRVLTMEFLHGKSFPEFLAGVPPQEERDRFGSLTTRAHRRLIHRGRMQYADPHPGNYLFLPDRRLGKVDFGCMRVFSDEDWAYLREADEAMRGTRADVEECMRHGTEFTATELDDRELMDAMVEYAEWIWQPMKTEGAFDYGDAQVMQRGLQLIRNFTSRWRPAQKPVNVFIQRSTLGGWGIQHRLRARVQVNAIVDEEIQATGWRQ